MTETKQAKIPSFAAMRKLGAKSKPAKTARHGGKPSSLNGVCVSAGGAGESGEGKAPAPAHDKGAAPVSRGHRKIGQPAGKPVLPAGKPVLPAGKPVTDYVLGPLQMHCLREFAAGRCDRLEITPGYSVPFVEEVGSGRRSSVRLRRPAVMRCERLIYNKKTGAHDMTVLKVIPGKARASRCSAVVELGGGIRYEDCEEF